MANLNYFYECESSTFDIRHMLILKVCISNVTMHISEIDVLSWTRLKITWLTIIVGSRKSKIITKVRQMFVLGFLFNKILSANKILPPMYYLLHSLFTKIFLKPRCLTMKLSRTVVILKQWYLCTSSLYFF